MATPPDATVDRRFVITAMLLAAAYGLVVAVIAYFSKEAAGAAGVVLTALGTAIFARFADLRFPVTSPEKAVLVPIPRIRSWVVILSGLILFFATCLVLFLVLFIYLLIWFVQHPVANMTVAEITASYSEAFLNLGRVSANYAVVAVGFFLVTAAIYLLYGFVCTRIWPSRSAVLYAVFGAVVAQTVPVLITLGLALVHISRFSIKDAISIGLFVACAAIGWYFGTHSRAQQLGVVE
jgi:hypothetical protein